ncbi:MAG: redoxin domain-containing protein [Planctomycetaceae bacterium]
MSFIRRTVLVCLAAASPQMCLAEESPGENSLVIDCSAVNGEHVTVASGESMATVVCFLGTECPLAKLYGPRLSELAEEFSGQNVRVVGVMSNRQDSIDDIRRYVELQAISFPVIHDDGNLVANRYNATRTPEVFLLDRMLNVRYHGRVDDQYEPGITRSAPERRDLRIAIQEVLANKPVSVARTSAPGCLIGKFRPADSRDIVENNITYSQHVSRVLQRHCVECHRPGEIGPFAMDSFEEVVGWADTMLETIEDGRMPPWSADPDVGRFSNARLMPESDRQIMRDWIAGGLKRGDESQLPPPVTPASQWQLTRKPDVVIPMRDVPFRVPAQGTVEYQYFVVDPNFEEDQWIAGAQIIPGNRGVVHHAIAFIRPPDGIRMRGIGWLTAYVPGQRLVDLPQGYARRVPAGSKIVFQMHYTTNGRTQEDVTQIGLVFADPRDVTHEMITLIGINQEFEIPPHASDHEATGDINGFLKSGRLMSIAPHMHYRGRSFQVFADRADRTETLLSVPRYDFNWQHSYELAEPLGLAEIDRLHFSATFDNSEANPFNPNPEEWVTWGDQSWEEMAVVFLEVAEPRLLTSDDSGSSSSANAAASEREKKVAKFVSDFFRDLDSNGDGIVQRSEMPVAVRQFSRWRWDRDGDQQVTPDEVRAVAEERF